MRRFLLALSLGLSLLGCKEVNFENGEIPAEYLDEAQALAGKYTGRFDDEPIDMELRFNGARPELTMVSAQGGRCRFEYGDVLSARVDENQDKSVEIRRVTFRLKYENCIRARGDTVDLEIRDRDGRIEVTASLLYDTRWETVCRRDPYPPRYPGDYPPGYDCWREARNYYVTGHFRKQD